MPSEGGKCNNISKQNAAAILPDKSASLDNTQ